MKTNRIIANATLTLAAALCSSVAMAGHSCGMGHVTALEVVPVTTGDVSKVQMYFALDNLGAPASQAVFATRNYVDYIKMELEIDSSKSTANNDQYRYQFDVIVRAIHSAFLSGAPIWVWKNDVSTRGCNDLRPQDINLKACTSEQAKPCSIEQS